MAVVACLFLVGCTEPYSPDLRGFDEEACSDSSQTSNYIRQAVVERVRTLGVGDQIVDSEHVMAVGRILSDANLAAMSCEVFLSTQRYGNADTTELKRVIPELDQAQYRSVLSFAPGDVTRNELLEQIKNWVTWRPEALFDT